MYHTIPLGESIEAFIIYRVDGIQKANKLSTVSRLERTCRQFTV